MDPFAAIGLASAIVQFCDFSTKLINGAREIHGSVAGMTEESESLEYITREMKALSSQLLPSTGIARSDDEKALYCVAAECNILADQIFDLLEKVKPKDPGSKRQSIQSAVRSKIHEKERQELEKRLSNCRSQLNIQLNYLASSETKARLDILMKSAKGDAAKLERMQKNMDELRQGLIVQSMTPEAQTQIRKLLDLSEDLYRTVMQHRILKLLAFSDMHGRFEAVDSAHYKTFRWILGDELENDNDSQRDDFTLHRAPSPLWEPPRPDQSASDLFVHWLSSGNGFFHISGKLGSGKSTLMKFLCEHKRTQMELEKWAGEWNHLKSLPWQIQPDITLGQSCIREAFTRLLKCRDVYEKHCFCFFIDGLDEYKETSQEDYRDLVDLLHEWVKIAPDDVKMCVSSREYNVFLNGFSYERRIRLQDLTSNDMELYIRNRLVGKDGKDFDGLVEFLIRKANGIFLWVTLVIRSLRERLEDGYNLSTLEREVNELPDELEALFEHLLQSLSPSNRKKAYQVFEMIHVLSEHNFKLPIVAYSFIEEYEKDQEFAIRDSFPYVNLDCSTRKRRIEQAIKSANGCFKGLVEAVPDRYSQADSLRYTHRSVLDFLSRPDVQVDRDSHLKDFDLANTTTQLLLADLRSMSRASKKNEKRPWYLSRMIYTITAMRMRLSDHQPYRFQELLQSSISSLGYADPAPPPSCIRIIPCSTNRHQAISKRNHSRESCVITSITEISAYLGDCNFLSWKIRSDPKCIDTHEKVSLLLSWAFLGFFVGARKGCCQLVINFLRQGSSPKLIMSFESIRWNPNLCSSMWECFILYTICHGSRLGDGLWQTVGETIEVFLKYGADPHVHVSMVVNQSVRHGEQNIELSIIDGEGVCKTYSQESHMAPSLPVLIDQGGKISLRDLVRLQEFENEDKILELIDNSPIPTRKEGTTTETEQGYHDEDGTTELVELPQINSEHILRDDTKPEVEGDPFNESSDLTKISENLSVWVDSLRRWSPIATFLLGILIAVIAPRVLKTLGML